MLRPDQRRDLAMRAANMMRLMRSCYEKGVPVDDCCKNAMRRHLATSDVGSTGGTADDWAEVYYILSVAEDETWNGP